VFLLYVCQKYPGTRWGLGRTDLSNLKQTTLVKFWQVCEDLGFKRGKDFQTAHLIYREHKNEIEFGNSRKILLLDLYYYPSDEAMTTISGLDLTGAAIDEANELDGRVRDKIFERCDR
jgi:phage terminase large subunit